MQNQVELKPEGLVIEHLNVNDPETVDYYRGLELSSDLSEEVRMAMRIGTIMMARANVSGQSDYLDKRVQEIVGQVETRADVLLKSVEGTIRKTFDPEEADSAIVAVKGIIDGNLEPLRGVAKWMKDEQTKLEASFNPANSDGYTGRMLKTFELLEQRFNGMFDPQNKESFPSWIEVKLGDLIGSRLAKQMTEIQEGMRRELQGIREDLAKTQSAESAVAEVSQITPIKGDHFQDEIYSQLQNIAKSNGDIVTDTTNVIGEVSASKKGDYNYDVTGAEEQRIAIECKDSPMASCPKVLIDMGKTMLNRKASFGIHLVKSEEQLQKQIGSWQVYRDRQVIITHVEMLEPSIRVAKLLMELTSHAVEGVDIGAIETHLVAIGSETAKSKTAKTKLSNIEDAVTALRTLEDERRKRIEDAITTIRDELSKASKAVA
mgnify:CR=1 FL=1|tara:strand:+ start:5498 stop:6796 length:1299 start_codon:yes stop_codon:yes gene_type:complete